MELKPDDARNYLEKTLKVTEDLIVANIRSIQKMKDHEYRLEKLNQFIGCMYAALILGTPLTFYLEMRSMLKPPVMENQTIEQKHSTSSLEDYTNR